MRADNALKAPVGWGVKPGYPAADGNDYCPPKIMLLVGGDLCYFFNEINLLLERDISHDQILLPNLVAGRVIGVGGHSFVAR